MGGIERDAGCGCQLDPDGEPDGLVVLAAEVDGVTASIAVDPACPVHGGAVRAMRRHVLRGLSLRSPASGAAPASR